MRLALLLGIGTPDLRTGVFALTLSERQTVGSVNTRRESADNSVMGQKIPP